MTKSVTKLDFLIALNLYKNTTTTSSHRTPRVIEQFWQKLLFQDWFIWIERNSLPQADSIFTINTKLLAQRNLRKQQLLSKVNICLGLARLGYFFILSVFVLVVSVLTTGVTVILQHYLGNVLMSFDFSDQIYK